MTFFSPDKLKPRKIVIEPSRVSCESPEVQNRLDRISENYRQVDAILADLESQIAADERLKALDDANVDFESLVGVKKKRKWRSPKPKSKSKARKSANPKKPR